MSFVRRLFGLESRSINNPAVSWGSDEFWEALEGGTSSDAGETVTHRKALGYAPLYQAVSMISGDVAKLPLAVYRRLDEKGREIDKSHRAFDLIQLNGRANKELSSFKMWRRFMTSALLWNNGWAWVEKNVSGRPLGIYNLLPDRTSYKRIGGTLRVVTEVDGRLWDLDPDDVLHIEGVSIDGQAGEDIVRLFRHDIGQALAARKFTSKFFANGATPGGVLMVPPGAKTTTVRKVEGGVDEKYKGTSKAFKTMVLRDGFRWVRTQVDPKQASVSQIDEDQARNVARIYNLDPSRLGLKASTSYNSQEWAERDYHNGTLSHWLVSIKSEANLKLLRDDERATHFVDYNVNALHWTDAKTRNQIAKDGIASGRFSPNETRAWENMNPYDGGDEYYRPLNMQPVSEDAGPDEGTRSVDRS